MGKFKLAEHFVSINGEGQKAGELALFLRFVGCNLSCSWCDTKWANRPDTPFEEVDTSQLVKIAADAYDNGVRNITLTGGEPLLQENIFELICELKLLGMQIEVETNGSVPITDNVMKTGAKFTMDYKLPSSCMEEKMCLDNLSVLSSDDTLKFVCGSENDLFRAKQIIDKYSPKCMIYFSPVFNLIQPSDIVEFMKNNRLGNVRLQLQLHKFIWDPDKRGV